MEPQMNAMPLNQIADQYQVNRRTLLKAIAKKSLKALRVGNTTFVKPKDLERWIERFGEDAAAANARIKQKTKRKAKVK